MTNTNPAKTAYDIANLERRVDALEKLVAELVAEREEPANV